VIYFKKSCRKLASPFLPNHFKLHRQCKERGFSVVQVPPCYWDPTTTRVRWRDETVFTLAAFRKLTLIFDSRRWKPRVRTNPLQCRSEPKCRK